MLSYIAGKFFHESPLLAFPLFALAVFCVVFLAWVVRTVITNKEQYEALARLPLDAGEGGVSRGDNQS